MFSKEKKSSKILLLAILILVCFLIAGCEEPSKEIRLGNKPFLYELDDEIGVLLIHGFTASPWEVKELAQFLADKNITSYGILLPGHGTDVRNLKETEWEQWHEASKNALMFLKNKTKKIYVGGVSLGASIALALAEEYDFEGVISVSSPIYLRNPNSKYADILKHVREYYPADLTDEEKFYYYDKKPLASVAELMEFIDYYKKDLSKVTEPVLILQSEEDKTIEPYSAAIIYERISSKDKEIKWFKGDTHVLLKSDYKDQVFDAIYGFIKRTSAD